MVDPLEPLLVDGVIDEVVARLKSGKEADLWLVRQGQAVLAAKVYKARETRSFKNNSAYLEGRRTRNSRTQRAMDRGSKFGQAAAEEAWKTKEADALHALHAAGVRVPRPVLFYEGVLLMEVVLDASGHPAPRLIDAEVSRDQAAELYAVLRSQVVQMLCCDLVHGDLSAYNVLLGWEGPVIIDFPQVVGAAHNSQAEGFFFRDLANLRHYFEAIDPAIKGSAGDGREIWRAYTKRELTPDFVPAPPRPGAPPPPIDRRELPLAERPPPQQRPQQRTGQQQQRAAKPSRPPLGRPQQQRPQQQRPQRQPGRGGQQPRGPVVERRPVLGAQAAPMVAHAPQAGTPAEPGQGRKRRRRRRGSGGGSAPG